MIRVLVVDDDKLARKGLISIMPWACHNMEVVGEAANGAKALEFLNENAVDLMFVDLAMPVVSGIDLIKEARKKYQDLQFVVLTFHEDFEYVQTAYRLGAIDYISKARLEKDDYEQIFDRIQKNLSVKSNQTIQADAQTIKYSDAPAVAKIDNSEEKCRNLERSWRTLYWLYDDVAFEKLCAQTVASGLSSRYLEGVFARVVSRVEIETNMHIDAWLDVDNNQSAVNWIRHYRETLFTNAAESDDMSETAICIFKTILYIRGHISDSLHAEQLATQIGMSRSYFCQCFKKKSGITFNDYVRQERIECAKRLLTCHDQTVISVSQAVGYTDVKYFSHIFHDQTGLLPSEYRSKHKTVDK